MFGRKVEAGQTGGETTTWEENIRPVRKYLEALIVTNRLPGQDGVDLLIIGDDKTKKLTRWADVMERKQGRPLNYVILSPNDYSYRRSVRDKFIADVLEMEISETIDLGKILDLE